VYIIYRFAVPGVLLVPGVWWALEMTQFMKMMSGNHV